MMKQYKITFMALVLLSSTIIAYPKDAYAFVTTDISEAAGRIAATVGDVLRMGGINLEKGENQATAEQIGEGTKETEAYIDKVNNSIAAKAKGWATDFAKKRLKTGNPDKQKIRDNALRLAEIEAEILELNLQLTLVETEKTLYYTTVEKAYQEKLAAYEANKQKILQETQKLNVLKLAEQKVAEYKSKLKAEFDAKLDDKLKEVNEQIGKASATYEQAKKVILEANEQQHKALQQELAIAQADYTVLERELEEMKLQLEENKASNLDTTALEAEIQEKTKQYEELEKKLTEIPEKQKKAEENAIADADNLLSDFEVEKETWLKKYAETQAFLEVEMHEKIANFTGSILDYDVNNSADKRGALEDQMNELSQKIEVAKAKGEDTSIMEQEMLYLQEQHASIQETDVDSLLDGSFARDTASDVMGAMEEEIASALNGVLALKASYEDKLQRRIADINNQIRTLRKLRAQLQEQLAEQTAKYLLKSLGINLTDPRDSLNQALKLNFLDKKTPESAEAIDEIRRNRLIERRDAILSSYSDAVMLKLRIGDDLDIIEHFADNTNSMDTVSGVIGADTDIKIKTIEALMQYAELLVAELRLETATELAVLNTYKVKNPDKEITNFNLDDYLFNCVQ